jgi:hypothetical protein
MAVLACPHCGSVAIIIDSEDYEEVAEAAADGQTMKLSGGA